MNKILQFKISLKRSNPKIWRRFQIENNLMWAMRRLKEYKIAFWVTFILLAGFIFSYLIKEV